MKRVIPIVLSLAGCLLLFSQSPTPAALQQSIQSLTPVSTVSPAITRELVGARRQVLKQQDILLKARALPTTDPSAAAATQQAQAQLEASQKAAAELSKQAAPHGTAAAGLATKDEAAHVIQLVTSFYQEMKQEAQSASSWELALIFTAIGLGFGSTVFSIFSFNKASAVFSALVVVTGGIPKIIPIHERAVYYKTLTNQSYSLLSGLNIPFELTKSECDDGARRLQVLEDYRATKYPQTSDVDSTTEDLFKDLNAAKTETAEAH